ncbi:unnamed protein product [Microthlaspi erraticum]|uniref:Uncharacterized protein n=1 Tax=Microthlaspi erraticum TaxID=1685480 RepID=A0A6D2HXE9_9BRAS|nr:unnamed protein product [Microthlaspi erraticum]
MALLGKWPRSSSSSRDEIKPWKIEVQTVRTWEGNNKEQGKSIDMVLLDASGTRLNITMDEDVAFTKWIKDIANDSINKPKGGETDIDTREDLLIANCENHIETMVREVFGENYAKTDRAMLCPTNSDAKRVNDYITSQLPGEEKDYLSADSLCPANSSPSDHMLYPLEMLNTIETFGMPNHSLKLKVGVHVTLLQDISPNGLCNGQRLQITRLGNHVIEARVMSGKKADEKVLLPRIPMYFSPPETRLPFAMRRKQFPIAVAYAMTVRQSQGQRLSRVGLYLPRKPFFHGQLHVGISKVKSNDGLKVLITDSIIRPHEKPANAVFREVFQNV